MFERQDVADIRAAEHVDRLIIIAHDAEVATLAGEVPHHQVLGAVRVLVLVDHDVLEPLLVFLEHRRVPIEEPDRPHQEIVEIERPVLLEKRVIPQADLRGQLLVVGAGRLCLVLGADDLVLGPRDERDHAAGWIALLIQAHLGHDALNDGEPVGLVVNDEVPVDPVRAPVSPQDADPNRVEGPHPDPTRGQVEQLLDSAAHLPRRLVGERHRQDFAGLGPSLLDQPGDPVGQHPCLATAGAGKDQQRPVLCGDGGALRRIESG